MRLFALILAALAFGAQAALTAPGSELIGKSVVEPARADLGRVEDLATGEVRHALLAAEGDLRRVPVQKLLAPASGEALVLNVEQREELL
jgi:hypothetical protein